MSGLYLRFIIWSFAVMSAAFSFSGLRFSSLCKRRICGERYKKGLPTSPGVSSFRGDYVALTKSFRRYAAASSISIDQSLLPGPIIPLRSAKPVMLWLLFYSAIVSLRAILPKKSQNFLISSTVAVIDFITQLISSVIKLDFAFAGKIIKRAVQGLMQKMGFTIAESFDLQNWNVCTLAEKEVLGESYTKYRFDVPSMPNGILDADIGQEIQICAVDARGKTLKGNFFPLTARNDRGRFHIVCRSGEYMLNEKNQMAMQFMSKGDELAFKGGKRRLIYTGSDEVINSMTLIASGLGITPAFQILSAVLPDEDSTVEDIEVLWINENREDFILAEGIAELETAYDEQLFVTRVLDTDANNLDTQINAKLRRAIMPYEYGRIAVIMGPEALATKSQVLLQEMGYPDSNILLIPCP